MPISYDLDLNLPTDPGLPPGEEYDEFRQIYNALRQLQDGISEAAGLVTLTGGELTGAGVLEIYGLRRHNFFVVEAGTSISIGQPCQFYNSGTAQAKVRQPCVYYSQHTLENGRAAALSSAFYPLFAAGAGEKLAVVGIGGTGPMPGAVPGTRYWLNSAFAQSTTAGKISYFNSWDLFGTTTYMYLLLGRCIEANKIHVAGQFWASRP